MISSIRNRLQVDTTNVKVRQDLPPTQVFLVTQAEFQNNVIIKSKE